MKRQVDSRPAQRASARQRGSRRRRADRGPACVLGVLGCLLVRPCAAFGQEQPPAPQPPPGDTEERLQDLEAQVKDLKIDLDKGRLGTTQFLITGYGATGFTAAQGENSTFGAQFNPIFLWKLSDQLFAAAEVELELEDNDTNVELEYFNLSWLPIDNLTLRVGLFLTPLSTFNEQLHPAWINRLPDQPLFTTGDGAIVPVSSLGVEARGGVRLGSTRLTYSVYLANGSELQTGGAAAGQLSFDDYTDINNNKAVGARIGFLPIPELEIAYALQYGNAAPDGSGIGSAYVWTHDVSGAFAIERDAIAGRLEVRAEFAFADFQGDVDFGAGPFNNDRSGGYVQVSYRPTKVGAFFKNLEGVVRYDYLNQPSGAPTPFDEQRLAIGLDYWLSPSTVVKTAYEFDDVNDPSGATGSSNVFLLQFAMGF